MESLLTLEDSVGDIDKYAAKELGYRNVEQLHDALMGLQVDSVASAIYQIKEKTKALSLPTKQVSVKVAKQQQLFDGLFLMAIRLFCYR